MATTFGRQVIGNFGGSIQVSADGLAKFKTGGVTVDWDNTVTALSADTLFPDGVQCYNGEKVLRYGQVLTLIGTAQVETVTFTGGPTGGSTILTLPAVGDHPAQSTVPIAYNASAATFQAALQGISRIGPNGVTVTVAGAGSAGSPYVYTCTFNYRFPASELAAFTQTNTWTGGTSPTTTMSITTPAATSGGKYGPFDSAASDGRQTLTKGNVYVLNETIREVDHTSAHPPVIYGGKIFKQRLLCTVGTHSLAAGPTFAELEAVLGFDYVDD